MIAETVAALCRRPSVRRVLWRSWYQHLARIYRRHDWTFMNYGYAGGAPLDLPAPEEPDRYSIQLYHHVAGAVDLRDREVLEVGSGRGGGAACIQTRLGPRRMVGVDYSQNNVTFARRAHPVPGLSFERGDAENLPFDDASFDVVLNLESSHCYGSLPGFYREAARVLRPGGHFLYADLFGAAEIDAVRSWLRTFELLREEDITADVLASLHLDHRRKWEMIRARLPRWLFPLFTHFAGLEGSRVYQALEEGGIIYRRFVLRR